MPASACALPVPVRRCAVFLAATSRKVAIGKWLRGDANVLIFDEPTKGVDVKAKTDLFMLIDGLAPGRQRGDLCLG